MINVAIFDESNQIDKIEMAIVSALFSENDLNIDMFDSEEEYSELLQEQGCIYDIVFLAIDSDEKLAFRIAHCIREYSLKTEIVFISNIADSVFASFRYNPFDFILNSSTAFDFSELFDRYNFYHNSSTDEYFSFKSGSYSEKIKISAIQYFYSSGRKIIIVTKNKEYEFYSKLDDVEALLKENLFLRIHQSYLVNYSYIKYITHNDLVLENDTYLPISRNRLKDVRETYMKFIG